MNNRDFEAEAQEVRAIRQNPSATDVEKREAERRASLLLAMCERDVEKADIYDRLLNEEFADEDESFARVAENQRKAT